MGFDYDETISTGVFAQFEGEGSNGSDNHEELTLEQQTQIMREAINCTPEQLEELDITEYSNKLRIIANTEPQIVDEYLPVIIDQYKKFLTEHPSSRVPETLEWDPQFEDAFEIGNTTRTALWMRTHGDGTVDSALLERAYDLIYDDSPMVRHFAIEFTSDLARLDSRNRDTDQYLNLWGKMRDDVKTGLLDFSKTQNQETAVDLIDTFWAESPSSLPGILVDTLRDAKTEAQVGFCFSSIANRIGVEKARKEIKQAGFDDGHFRFIEASLGFSSRTEQELANLYKQVQEEFRNYKPNEDLNKMEIGLLTKNIDKNTKTLDIGFGYGRLLSGLKNEGYEVNGIDYVYEHVKAVKDNDSSANVLQGSWHAMPYQNESFDNAYCLGRSILHNQTVEDMSLFLRESNRILKDGGKLIVDIPDPNFGHYAEERKKYEEAASKIGSNYFESGAIVDSPDGKHFFDRFAPELDQFSAIARLAGFNVEVIHEQIYTDEENFKNKNMYLKLTKAKQTWTGEEFLDLVSQTRTSSPSLRLSWI